MTPADISKYLEIPYCRETFDCADLVQKVLSEMFGVAKFLPVKRARGAFGQVSARSMSANLADRVEVPTDGDVCLMTDFGMKYPGHIGVAFNMSHEVWVLHNTETMGCSIMTALRDLPNIGLTCEGFYRVKN